MSKERVATSDQIVIQQNGNSVLQEQGGEEFRTNGFLDTIRTETIPYSGIIFPSREAIVPFLSEEYIVIETTNSIKQVKKSEQMKTVERQFIRPLTEILREQRFTTKLPSDEAAEILGVSRRTYSRWMKGLEIDHRPVTEIMTSMRHPNGKAIPPPIKHPELSANERRGKTLSETWDKNRQEMSARLHTLTAREARGRKIAERHAERPGKLWRKPKTTQVT